MVRYPVLLVVDVGREAILTPPLFVFRHTVIVPFGLGIIAYLLGLRQLFCCFEMGIYTARPHFLGIDVSIPGWYSP